jgi:flagellar motor switch protein FliG
MEDKTIVLTMYGKDETVESISISLFDKASSYNINQNSNAINYCENINNLELKENNWVYASIIDENEKIALKKPYFFDTNNFDIINELDDRSLQKILREVSTINLAMALKNVNEETKEKVFKNMSKRASIMLKEDIEILNQVSDKDINLSKKKIIEIIKRLNRYGEIYIARII